MLDEKLENEEENVREGIHRRKVLSRVSMTGVSTVGLFGFTSAASARKRSGLNTNFNSNDTNEVHQFVRELNQLDREEAKQILQSLNRKRQEAVAEAMRVVDYEVDVKRPVQTQDSEAETIIRTVTAKSAAGNLAYKYSHTFSWEWENGEVIDASADAGPVDTGLPWKYIGDSKSTVIVTDDSARSYQTGEFGLCIYVPTCVITERAYPYINIHGYPGGDYDVASDDDDGNNSPG